MNQSMKVKRPMKESGLIGPAPVPVRRPVLPNVSGRDVSAAVARMPSFDDEETGESGPALMESGALATHRRQAGRFFHVNVELLDDSPYQPRRTYDEGALSALAESLRHFQEEAIVVKLKDNGRYELVSGHRRKRAAALAQIRSLEARLFERGDDEAAISALVTNEAREDLSDYERALSYRALLDSGRKGGAIKTQDQLGQRIGRGQSLVAKRLALLKLPKSILDLLDEFPRAVTVNSLAELNRVLATHPAEDRLIAELRRVAQGQISMATLASILVSSRATQAGVEQPRQSLSLQLGSRLFAQATPNHSKRQVMIKLPGECDLDEVAELVMDAIRVRYSGA